MSDPDGKKDLFEKFKSMSEDDLIGYKSAGQILERICAILGIGSILFILTLQSVFGIVAMSLIVFILAQVAGATSETIKHIEKSLERFDR